MKRNVALLPVIFFAASILLIPPVFVFPADWAGWVLVYFSFTIPLFFAPVRADRKLLITLFVFIAAHNAVSIYNVYGSTIFGAGLDAVTFQELARDLASTKYPLWFVEFDALEVGTNIYTRFLATFYRIFGVSLLLGQSLSVIAYTFSCIVLIYIARLFSFRHKRSVLIFYCLPAPAIIYCSITMREAWQVLFFLLIIYLTLLLRSAPSLLKTLYLIICGLAFGFLHNGLFVYSLLLLGWSLYWGASGKWRKAGYQKILFRAGILCAGIIAFLVWFNLGGEIGGVAKAIRSGETTAYAEQYRERGEQDAAASYQVRVDSSSVLAFLTSGTMAFVYYQFAPFPWLVRRTIDIYATLESILRFILLIYMLRLWWRAKRERKSRYEYIIICYLSLEFLWSLGTANWGTSARHHVVAHGALVLLGVPGAIYSVERLLSKLMFRRKASRFKSYQLKGAKMIS